ncbi:DUF1998 domain-containing protein [Sporosarcina saromensis]|uniref:DUF1998 domain-containing protein n=1 Tax=Sporosarcina saromensis TaxID=359365 RepID=A0ABU4G3P0_9BACL|nr:DUF1998 domain-containing protein [Sporosarcina saromensis]
MGRSHFYTSFFFNSSDNNYNKNDIRDCPQVSLHSQTYLVFYDSYPGGIGLSEKLFNQWKELLERAAEHVRNCRCKNGCPACIGAQEEGIRMKKDVIFLLNALIGGESNVLRSKTDANEEASEKEYN